MKINNDDLLLKEIGYENKKLYYKTLWKYVDFIKQKHLKSVSKTNDEEILININFIKQESAKINLEFRNKQFKFNSLDDIIKQYLKITFKNTNIEQIKENYFNNLISIKMLDYLLKMILVELEINTWNNLKLWKQKLLNLANWKIYLILKLWLFIICYLNSQPHYWIEMIDYLLKLTDSFVN
ncbi:hypothetical protein [Mycoplasma zalophi]|uniref:hypothetical protein n=1 Tax=Mycoplasma zalophi TaxID=191287 RepID=UPI001C1209CB|nr:hypothetical protein [Mycoplasma zalophi]MBU4690835.1 hypothetical protein [Mycoplasma zalophi]